MIVLVLHGVAAAILAVLIWHARVSRAIPGAAPFVVTTGLALGWVLATICGTLSHSLSAKIAWDQAEFIFIAFLPPAVLALVLDYTGRRRWLVPPYFLPLCLVPLVTVVLTWTNHHHQLMRTDVWLLANGPVVKLAWNSGPWFLVHAGYSYALLLAALGLLVQAARTSPPAYRRGPLVILAGLLLPIASNLAELLHPLTFLPTDLTPLTFSAAGAIFAWGLFRSELFTLVPAARHALVENMSDGLLVLDASERVADVNRAVLSLLGKPREVVLGRPVAAVWEDWRQLSTPCTQGTSLALLTPETDAAWRKYEVRITRLVKRDRLQGQILVFRDITERAIMEESLRVQALSDSLTGLGNRTLFMTKLTDALRQAQRHPERAFAVAILDLDRFKQINDTVGHLAGDVLLQHVAGQLTRSTRDIDTVARLGGDEFMLLLDGIGSKTDLLPILERVRAELQRPVSFHGREISTTTSMGVVIWDPSYTDPEDLLRAADTALYQAKEAGRDCYRLFDENMHRSVLFASRIETELRAALDRGEFVLEYQPVMNLESGQACALEAFVRREDPRRGLIPAGEFLETAENTGLIFPLGELVLDQLCRQIGQWRSLSGPESRLPVGVNLSPRQLLETDLVGAVLTRVAEWRVPPGSLSFEVTETALLRNPAKARRVLAELRTMGMQVCLDDFGSGFSSLQHLTSFPLTEVKLDRSLVARLPESATDRELARSVINLAHSMGLAVTADGVENSAQWRALVEAGCDRLQGYFLSPPVLAAELPHVLAHLAGSPGSASLQGKARGAQAHATAKPGWALPGRAQGEESPAPGRPGLRLVSEQPWPGPSRT